MAIVNLNLSSWDHFHIVITFDICYESLILGLMFIIFIQLFP